MAPPRTKPQDGPMRSEENSSGIGCALLPERCTRLVLIRRQRRLIGCVLRLGSLISRLAFSGFIFGQCCRRTPLCANFARRRSGPLQTIWTKRELWTVIRSTQWAALFAACFLFEVQSFKSLLMRRRASNKTKRCGCLGRFGPPLR